VTSPGVREHLLARLERAGASIDAASVDAFEQYFALLARWNPTINLTALPLSPPTDETFDRLFVEPVVAAKQIDPAPSHSSHVRWVDLGSGGGSPAIPLKIIRPAWILTMVEAKERKASFLREAIRALRLNETDVANVRFEDLAGRRVIADVVTVRAVRLDNAFADVTRKLLSRDGLLAVFSSSAVSLNGFDREECVPLGPQSAAVLTVLRVPRGT
jgi:16S rRNA (guanine527-N7)-methyltransferase